MGPTTILDKSAFQALTKEEHSLFGMWFLENIPPVLVFEIQGDLSKLVESGKHGAALVQDLARKFGGSGGTVSMDYPTLARGSLFGHYVPMSGHIVPHENTTTHRTEDGGLGMMVDLSPLNEAIMRWSQGKFQKEDVVLSRLWRLVTRNLSYTALQDQLTRNHIIRPRVTNRGEIVMAADSLLREPGLQLVWLDWLMDQLQMPAQQRRFIHDRWKYRRAFSTLKSFAPYAHHCLRSLLALLIAVHNKFLGWDPTHLVDLQYLYYLPFCQVFVSDDRVHKLLAPQLMRKNQVFIRGPDFKKDLKRMMTERDAIPDEEQRKAAYSYATFPKQPAASVVQQAWDKVMNKGGLDSEEEIEERERRNPPEASQEGL